MEDPTCRNVYVNGIHVGTINNSGIWIEVLKTDTDAICERLRESLDSLIHFHARELLEEEKGDENDEL
jgi:hypothetical protein